jgi:hypothetical protein
MTVSYGFEDISQPRGRALPEEAHSDITLALLAGRRQETTSALHVPPRERSVAQRSPQRVERFIVAPLLPQRAQVPKQVCSLFHV